MPNISPDISYGFYYGVAIGRGLHTPDRRNTKPPCGQLKAIRQYVEAPKQAQRRRGAIYRAL